MENVVCPSHLRTKFVYLLVKCEDVITFLTVFCAVSAIGSGVAWLAMRREFLLFGMLGLGACYLIGRNCWKFRD
jgi:hypothetical protein